MKKRVLVALVIILGTCVPSVFSICAYVGMPSAVGVQKTDNLQEANSQISILTMKNRELQVKYMYASLATISAIMGATIGFVLLVRQREKSHDDS